MSTLSYLVVAAAVARPHRRLTGTFLEFIQTFVPAVVAAGERVAGLAALEEQRPQALHGDPDDGVRRLRLPLWISPHDIGVEPVPGWRLSVHCK